MTIFYLDYENGNNANDGSSWALSWKDITSGATAARIAPGDTIRIAKSPAPASLGCTAAWTNLSRTVTLTTAQTTTIELCESAWTAGGGDVATPATSTTNKQGTYAQSLPFNAAPQASILQAYKTTGTLDLSGYQKISFWFRNSIAVVANNFKICLCSDLLGGALITGVVFSDGGSDAVLGTKVGHGLLSGAKITVSGCTQAYANATWVITRINDDTFTLDGASWTSFTGADVTGDCSPIADSFLIPAVPSTAMYLPLTLARVGGGNLCTSIQSIALYTDSSAPSASIILLLDDFIACTTSGLNLQSLISKNTAEQGGTEGWYGIKNIDGVTVNLDTATNDNATTGEGYSGTTETVTTYKRETIKTALASSSSTVVQEVMDSGTTGNNIQFQGGYDTGTSNQTGETFFDGLNGNGYGLQLSSKSYITVNYLNVCRYYRGVYLSNSTNNTFTTVTNVNNNTNYGIYLNNSNNNTFTTVTNANNNTNYGIYLYSSNNNTFTTVTNVNNNTNYGISLSSSSNNTFTTVSNANNNNYGIYLYSSNNNTFTTVSNANNNNYGIYLTSSNTNTFTTVTNANNNNNYGIYLYSSNNNTFTTVTNANNNSSYGIFLSSSNTNTFTTVTNANNNTNYGISLSSSSNNFIKSLSTTGNASAAIYNEGTNYIWNAAIAETTEVSSLAYSNARIFSHAHDNTAGNHWIFTDGGTINAQATTRHTASGIAWTLTPAAARISTYPLDLKVAKIACAANALVTVKIWMIKGHATNVVGKLVCRGGQLAGVPSDVTATKADDTSWEELTITFTPTEAGVIEIEVWGIYSAGTSTVTVDDMTISQA
jgi:L-rhamnose mutarotase